jgi:hypothetical protein
MARINQRLWKVPGLRTKRKAAQEPPQTVGALQK